MGQPIYQVDSFTATPFAGNPAGVCVMAEPANDAWMQLVAREMNLSETAFLTPQNDGYHLRWFTPTTEAPLCGHATLASAHILWEIGLLPPGARANFHTLSGLLTCEQRAGGWIEMNFPAQTMPAVAAPKPMLAALGGVTPLYCGYNATTHNYLIEVGSETIVRGMAPIFAQLAPLAPHGVIVTSRATTAGYDFVSRFFAPAIGINEDPVTGSSMCALAPYWSEKLGKEHLVGYQASARGGVVRAQPQGERVLIQGQAVTVLRGALD